MRDVKSFRPLSGNYISQWSVLLCLNLAFLFPSPVGELHFSMGVLDGTSHRYEKVSVPCRGTTFLNINNMVEAQLVSAVSVPCRGTTFLNTIPAIPPPVWAHGRDLSLIHI